MPSNLLSESNRVLDAMKQRYAKNRKFHKAAISAARRRYHEDPEYRLATIERAKARYRAKKAERERQQLEL